MAFVLSSQVIKHVLKLAVCMLFECWRYLVHQQLGHLHVVVKRSQVQCGVSVVLLLVYDPRPRQLGQQHTHRTAKKARDRNRNMSRCAKKKKRSSHLIKWCQKLTAKLNLWVNTSCSMWTPAARQAVVSKHITGSVQLICTTYSNTPYFFIQQSISHFHTRGQEY